MKTRQGPGRAGRLGDGEPRRQPKTMEPMGQIGQQHLLAAEQMGGTRDIEEEAVGAVLRPPRRDGRRIPRRPQRQAAQGGRVGNRIDGADLQGPGFRAGVGEQVAGQESAFFGRRVHGSDAGPAGRIDGEDERLLRVDRLRRACLRCEIAQDRPARQPD